MEHCAATVTLRELDPGSEAEVLLVARRMRQTLVEVLGPSKGEALYTMDWLVERVRWHLDPAATQAKVFLSIGPDGAITGHAIARIERGEDGAPYGYFSTLFVEPASRRRGIATALLEHVERWFVAHRMPRSVYNTAANHAAILALFSAHGYAITAREADMVQLTKPLPRGSE